MAFAASNFYRAASQWKNAKNGDDKEQAIGTLGLATLGIVGLGTAKPALKSAGVKHQGGTLSASAKVWKEIPRSFKVMGQKSKLLWDKMVAQIKLFKSNPKSFKELKVFQKGGPTLPIPNPATVNLNFLSLDKTKPIN